MILLKSRFFMLLLMILVLSSLLLHDFPLVRAQPNYAPGVKAGDSVTYGQFSANSTAPFPGFPANVSSFKLQVVSANSQTGDVNASLIYTHKNGTQSTQRIAGNTETGQGNLLPYIIAGNLTAGDVIYKLPYSYYTPYIFNATVERVYAGALRSVNLFNLTQTSQYSVQATFYWDAQTGLLLDAEEYANYSFPSTSTFSIDFKATVTNVWTRNANVDFTLDASSLSSEILHTGDSTTFRLELTSINNFTGNIALSVSIPSSNTTHAPHVSLDTTSVSLSKLIPTATALLTVSSNSTTAQELYIVAVNGTSGSILHKDRLLVDVAPPDFIISASPSNLTIAQRESKNSTITITGRGSFTGTVALQAQTPFGPAITANLSTTLVLLNSTVTKVTSRLTVSAANSQPGISSVSISANSGIIYRNIYIPVNVTGPDFRIAANPDLITLKQGQTVQSTITLTSIIGFTGPINLSSSFYGTFNVSFSATSLNLTAGGKTSTTLTITAPATTAPGIYYVTVTGTSRSGLSHSAYVNLNVTGPDFRFSANEFFLRIQAGQTHNSTLTLSSVVGFSGKVILSTSSFGPIGVSVNPLSLTLNATRTTATATLTVTVPPGTPPSFSQVTVTATSGNLSHSIYLPVSIVGPDFGVSTNPPFLSIKQGGSGKSVVSLSSINNFTGTVNLSANSPFTTTFSANKVNLAAGGSANSTLTVQASAAIAPGNYFVNIAASSGTLTRYGGVEVIVIGPDFSISAVPSFLTIPQGGVSNSTVTVTSIDNFKGPVALTVFNFNPLSVSPNRTVLTLTANSTATTSFRFATTPGTQPGNYFMNIDASAGNITHSVSLFVQVTGPDFGIFANPSSLTLQQGSSGSTTLTLSSIQGFAGNVSLSLLSFSLPAALTNSTVKLVSGGTASTSLTMQSSKILAPGSYSLEVIATSGVLSHTVFVSVLVIGPDFSIGANPNQLTVQAGGSVQSTITLSSIDGFNGTVTLSAFNFLTGVNPRLSATNVTLRPGSSVSVVLNVTTTDAAAGTTVFLEIQGSSNGLTHVTSILITVTGPSFSLSSNPSFLTVARGSSASSTISITSLDGFSGNVSLRILFVFGPTASLNPGNVTLTPGSSATSTFSISVPSNTAPGFYFYTIDGNSGSIVRSASVEVQVTGSTFTMLANASFLTLTAGSEGSSTIIINGVNQFSGQISLTTSSFPTGPIAILNPSIVTLNSTVTSTTSNVAITIPADLASGFYQVRVTGASGGVNVTVTIFIRVTGGDFTLFANPSSVTLYPGSSASITLTVSGMNGFAGLVNFTAFAIGSGPGLEESFVPLNVTLSRLRPNATLTVMVSASPTTLPGSYAVRIIGASFAGGNFTAHSVTVEATVLAKPEFEINVISPADFNSGGQGTSMITITPVNGFSGIVSLASSTSPNVGLTVNCPSSLRVTSFAPVTGTCSLSSTTPGIYHVRITATSGGLTHNATIVSNVGGFTISVKTPVDFNSGSTGEVLVSIKSTNNFAGNITLTGSSTGLTVKCPAIAVSLLANSNSETACSVDGTVAGTYEVRITGFASPGSLSHSAKAVVHVGDFTISTSSGSFNTGASGASINISLTSTFNFAGSVSLSAVISPSTGLKVDCPASAISLTPNSTSTASCTSSSMSPDTYQIVVTGKGALGTASHVATSIVHVGDFAISITPADINSGSDGSISVSLTSINNFAGAISLSGTTSDGLTVTCPVAPTRIMANSTLPHSCTLSSITPGTYSVTVTGISSTGVASHSAGAAVHVGDFTISIGTLGKFDLGSPNALISVNLTSKLNFAGTVVLTSDVSAAKGLTVTCPALTLNANVSSSANCAVNADSVGTYLVTIKGSSLPGMGSHSSSGIVQVVDFKVSAGAVSPSTIPAGGSGTSSITIAPVNGFTGTVTLAVSPSSGLTCSFDPTTIQSLGTSNLSCTGNAPGDYSVTVTAIGGSTLHQTSLTFHVGSAPSGVSTSPTMFGLQLLQFYGLIGGIIVAIAVAAVTVAVRRKSR